MFVQSAIDRIKELLNPSLGFILVGASLPMKPTRLLKRIVGSAFWRAHASLTIFCRLVILEGFVNTLGHVFQFNFSDTGARTLKEPDILLTQCQNIIFSITG